jgi:hypothetical protein
MMADGESEASARSISILQMQGMMKPMEGDKKIQDADVADESG